MSDLTLTGYLSIRNKTALERFCGCFRASVFLSFRSVMLPEEEHFMRMKFASKGHRSQVTALLLHCCTKQQKVDREGKMCMHRMRPFRIALGDWGSRNEGEGYTEP